MASSDDSHSIASTSTSTATAGPADEANAPPILTHRLSSEEFNLLKTDIFYQTVIETLQHFTNTTTTESTLRPAETSRSLTHEEYSYSHRPISEMLKTGFFESSPKSNINIDRNELYNLAKNASGTDLRLVLKLARHISLFEAIRQHIELLIPKLDDHAEMERELIAFFHEPSNIGWLKLLLQTLEQCEQDINQLNSRHHDLHSASSFNKPLFGDIFNLKNKMRAPVTHNTANNGPVVAEQIQNGDIHENAIVNTHFSLWDKLKKILNRIKTFVFNIIGLTTEERHEEVQIPIIQADSILDYLEIELAKLAYHTQKSETQIHEESRKARTLGDLFLTVNKLFPPASIDGDRSDSLSPEMRDRLSQMQNLVFNTLIQIEMTNMRQLVLNHNEYRALSELNHTISALCTEFSRGFGFSNPIIHDVTRRNHAEAFMRDFSQRELCNSDEKPLSNQLFITAFLHLDHFQKHQLDSPNHAQSRNLDITAFVNQQYGNFATIGAVDCNSLNLSPTHRKEQRGHTIISSEARKPFLEFWYPEFNYSSGGERQVAPMIDCL